MEGSTSEIQCFLFQRVSLHGPLGLTSCLYELYISRGYKGAMFFGSPQVLKSSKQHSFETPGFCSNQETPGTNR